MKALEKPTPSNRRIRMASSSRSAFWNRSGDRFVVTFCMFVFRTHRLHSVGNGRPPWTIYFLFCFVAFFVVTGGELPSRNVGCAAKRCISQLQCALSVHLPESYPFCLSCLWRRCARRVWTSRPFWTSFYVQSCGKNVQIVIDKVGAWEEITQLCWGGCLGDWIDFLQQKMWVECMRWKVILVGWQWCTVWAIPLYCQLAEAPVSWPLLYRDAHPQWFGSDSSTLCRPWGVWVWTISNCTSWRKPSCRRCTVRGETIPREWYLQ